MSNLSRLKAVSVASCLFMSSLLFASISELFSDCLFDFIPEIAIAEASCNEADGQARIKVPGTVDHYNFSWSHGGTSHFADNLSAGVYYVTITSKASPNCSVVKELVVGDVGGPDLSFQEFNQTCEEMGSISLVHNDKVGDIYITIHGEGVDIQDTTNQESIVYSGLPSGHYFASVSNKLGCEKNFIFEISFVEALELLPLDMTMPNCTRSSGSIEIAVPSGVGPYQYCYDTNCISNIESSSHTFNDLSAGFYRFQVTDHLGCTGDTFVVIENNENEYPTLSDISYQHAECATHNGTITFFGEGNREDYYELFLIGDSVPIASTLGDQRQTWIVLPGRYYLKCTDREGCETIPATMNVLRPEHLDFTVDYNPPSSKQSCDGEIKIFLENYELAQVDIRVTGESIDTFLRESTTLNQLKSGVYEISVTYHSRRGRPCTSSVIFEMENAKLSHADLALKKELVSETACYLGDEVEFLITIFNQGELPVRNINLVEHLPEGLSFISCHLVSTSNWNIQNHEKYLEILIEDYLLPGEIMLVNLTAEISSGNVGDVLVNIAELGSFEDQFGRRVEDIDSTPDYDPLNDGTPLDNQVTDKGDQDDHDIETIIIKERLEEECEKECQLSCVYEVNVSLDELECHYTLSPNDFVIGLPLACEEFYHLHLYDEQDQEISNGIITAEHIGQKLKYRVTNFCNNNCCGFVNVRHLGGPVSLCRSGVEKVISSNSQTVELSIDEIDFGSYDPCGRETEVAFDSNFDLKTIEYDCTDLGIQFVNLYLRLLDSANIDSCSTSIYISEENNECTPAGLKVFGEIITSDFRKVEGVMVSIDDDHSVYSDALGEFQLADVTKNENHLLKLSSPSDYMNGISTMDLIVLQRHILGLGELPSVYHSLAADINRDGEINGSDLIELRKLILGIYTEFPNNTSWRFLKEKDESSIYNNPKDDLIDESYEFESLISDMKIDFIGVKVGDVNDSAISSKLDKEIDFRSQRWPLKFEPISKDVTPDIMTQVTFVGLNYERISGWQGTLEFDPAIISVVGVTIKYLELDESSFDLSRVAEGFVTFSMAHIEEVDLSSGSELFSLEVITKESINTNSIFALTSAITSAEAYRGYNEAVNLELSSTESVSTIVNVQPNPWVDQTNIGLYLVEAGVAELTFYDVQGRLLNKISKYFRSGANTLTIGSDALKTRGIIYVKLNSNRGDAEFKMIKL